MMKVRVYNLREGAPLVGKQVIVLPPQGFETVHVGVRYWLPLSCPECGSSGPFTALAKWVPITVDASLNVISVEDDEYVLPDLSDEGPGLQCTKCWCNFYHVPTIFPAGH